MLRLLQDMSYGLERKNGTELFEHSMKHLCIPAKLLIVLKCYEIQDDAAVRRKFECENERNKH